MVSRNEYLMRIKRFNGIEGVYVLIPQVMGDMRGRLLPAYDIDLLKDTCALQTPFVHSDIYYLVARGLVGLYCQEKNPRASLYRCLYGRAQVIAVDLREGSRSFGKYQHAILDGQECLGFFAKPGFATGCIGVNGPAVVYVEHSTRDIPGDQKTLKWDDPQVGVTWAGVSGAPLLGQRERMGVTLDQIKPYQL